MRQTQYQKEAGIFFAMAGELRHAYREGGSTTEIAELVDEIDTFCRYTDYPMLRQRGAALLNQFGAMAADGTA
jgi:hypothetical protein